MKLRLTPRAATDLEEIATYVQEHSRRGARRVEAALQNAFAVLSDHPEAGSLHRENVRRFALPRLPYLIFYRVDRARDVIDVLTIRHAARRPER